MSLPFAFDFKNPNYYDVYEYRREKLKKIRENPEVIPMLKQYYKNNIAQFINDWGCTEDPRNIEIGRPAITPFILFPKQEEFVGWYIDHWKRGSAGIVEKSRDVGATWCVIAISCALCLFYRNISVAFGSRKKEYVDILGDPKSIFFKIRRFLSLVPQEFRGGWIEKRDSSSMKTTIPETDAKMTGEAGNNIGRGNRAAIVNIDESAFLENPDTVERSLSATSNCRIDISTPNGSNNPFYMRRMSGKVDVFIFDWRDDPRKDQAWYDLMCEKLIDPVIIAQELDRDYTASIENIMISQEWVKAAIDAHEKLGIEISGEKLGALDVADEGRDLNAFIGRHGIVAIESEEWSGSGIDHIITVDKCFDICDAGGYSTLFYDADGMGAAIRGIARVKNTERVKNNLPKIVAIPYRGSGSVINPDMDVFKRKSGEAFDTKIKILNKNYFQNFKAQAWFSMRQRFFKTYRAVKYGDKYEESELISISSKIKHLHKLAMELSQPTYDKKENGKIVIDKKPNGGVSPNLADAFIIAFAPIKLKTWSVYDL